MPRSLPKSPASTDCANVTASHLGAITGTLNLKAQSISALLAGDFEGLTALTKLDLSDNTLTALPEGVFDNLTALADLALEGNTLAALPDDVFDDLTALTILDLTDNALTELPEGVFDKLTALDQLWLTGNGLTELRAGVFDKLTLLTDLLLGLNALTELPDDVFEPLTELTQLALYGNPEAPFVPTAVALPDDGTVPVAGGTVTLDGSSSGGPWGTNVEYEWELTDSSSGVTVTFDDPTSAMPVVTIPDSADGSTFTFTLTVTRDGLVSRFRGADTDTDTATVTARVPPPNAAPVFTSAATFNAEENQTEAGTVEASDSDADDSVTYAIQDSADGAQFTIVASSGVLTFVSAPNYEDAADADTDNDYVVVVRASSGTGAREKTVDQTITVTVTDVGDEAPGAPATPEVSPASVSSLNVSWAVPSNAGPPITDYDYRYRVKSPAGSWTEVTNTTISVTNTTITGLAEGTEYEVQVRATNAEGTSPWSEPSGSGSTDANAAPVFDSLATFSAAENQTAVGRVQASDSDDSVTYAIQGGADAAQFTIVASSGVLTFVSAPNYEAAADADTDNDYVVVVRASSGTGAREKTVDQTITVTVTDVGDEAPGAPATPSVSSASVTSLNVSWTAPSNAGPPITDYDYRYRVKSPPGVWNGELSETITELSATITGLAADTEYEVQVRATNAEGTGPWSEPPGSGSTDANAAPSFDSAATFNAAENQTAVGTVQASDSDAGDSVTGYAIRPGADAAQFTIVASSGVLTFVSAPNYEDAADADTDNDYVVVVRASSGTGAREKTADQTITVTVTDVDGEAPGAPATPSVSSASGSSLSVSWTAPSNAGPPITDYDYQYRVKSPPGSWTPPPDSPSNVSNLLTELSTTITGLAADTEYEVQVRATNAEGTGDWSEPPGSGSTDANAAPVFTSAAAFDAAENQTVVGTVQASDSDAGDDVTGFAIQPGADEAQFTIEALTGVLTFKSEPNFEAPADADADNNYEVVVRVTSGTGTREKTADQTITVTVTNVVGEAPGARASATRSELSASGRSLTVTWTAPPNAGPPITDYDYRYRVESSPEWTEVTDTPITELSTTITGLEANTKYEVQVRATNAEGTGDWFALRSDPAPSSASASPAPTRRGGGGTPACTQDDVHANTAAQATDSGLSAVTAGAICPAADVDYFTVTAPGQGLVFVDTTGGVQTRGTIRQTDVVLASGSTGEQQNERLGARVQAGPVVVAVEGQDGATGPYAVEITFVQGYLENPGADSFQSGVGLLSGWVCDADMVEIELNGMPQEAAYGTERLDTASVCRDTDNGFGLLFNWNLLSDGEHEVVALVDGVELDRATVTVTTLGTEFLRDVTGTCEVADFPTMDETVTLVWQQRQQSFVIVDGPAPAGPTNRMGTPGEGYLENPGPNSFQSGIGVLSGWVCDAETVELAIGTAGRQVAAYGTERLDTQGACGDTANGFGLLFNWNLLGEGEHEVVAYVDDVELGRATVRVTTLGVEFVLDVEGECVVEDFPMPGETVTLEWQQNSQNFVITAVE